MSVLGNKDSVCVSIDRQAGWLAVEALEARVRIILTGYTYFVGLSRSSVCAELYGEGGLKQSKPCGAYSTTRLAHARAWRPCKSDAISRSPSSAVITSHDLHTGDIAKAISSENTDVFHIDLECTRPDVPKNLLPALKHLQCRT